MIAGAAVEGGCLCGATVFFEDLDVPSAFGSECHLFAADAVSGLVMGGGAGLGMWAFGERWGTVLPACALMSVAACTQVTIHACDGSVAQILAQGFADKMSAAPAAK